MRRRDFITLLGGAVAWPLAARAQQSAVPVIGFLNGASAWEYTPQTAAFRRGLNETGYVEGRNVLLEYRWAEGHYERLPTLAADLMRRQPAVIASGTIPATMAAKAATTTTPIVFLIGADPVEIGFVASLNRPGGNLTGVTSLAGELGPKRVELLHELVPKATIIAALVNPAYPAAIAASRDLQAAARSLGLQLHVLNASSERDIDAAFATLVQLKAGGLVISGEAFFNTRSEQLAALSVRHAVPTISQYREFAAAGGLLSYGGSQTDSYRIAGIYAGRILKGEKPADLSVQRSTKVELFINLKTVTRADEVIE